MENYFVGLDVGSTTIKTAVLNSKKELVYSSYDRHFSDIKATLHTVLSAVLEQYPRFTIMVTGSGGISVAEWLGIPFIQEVIAGVCAIKELIPDTDVAIELGGEDAKITYLSGGLEQRMNGTCAGGTGAFIDQMSSLLNTDAAGLNELAKAATIIYPIASRCGVFAKSDIQPLINDGAQQSDVAASVFQSVVNQTISGLACGKPIKGRVAYLGGPLHFLSELRARFVRTLEQDDPIVPEHSEVFNAIGAALSGEQTFFAADLKQKLEELSTIEMSEVQRLPVLFSSEEEIESFTRRHAQTKLPSADLSEQSGPLFLGIDAGSTTTKLALINDRGQLVYSFYGNNQGDPLKSVMHSLRQIHSLLPQSAYLGKCTITGYGESMLKAALSIDQGEIETMAHQTASNAVLPGVEFILDIGGQDMKCLRIKNGVIHDILLNEACSSGCGSFIETFAQALGYQAEEFARMGMAAQKPVDLGSRCTVFMNSRVKQAQKEGATVNDISAGLAYSVVKNALFKVIKLRDISELGERVIVQGGTFLNGSVLRAFELITGKEVIRPDQAGLMGAYGCALISKNTYTGGRSSILSQEQLESFSVTKQNRRCEKCGNHCLLTISKFSDGREYISNNRCEKGGNNSEQTRDLPPNLYREKYKRLFGYKPLPLDKAPMGTVGIPRVLNMYENYPFWFTFFTELGYRVELSPRSSRAIYDMGIESMPSESVCYPAKIVHGHIMSLVQQGIRFIFYPCIPYEIKEDTQADNHYNCPIVSTYPEVIRNNMNDVLSDGVRFSAPFLPLSTPKRMEQRLMEEFPAIAKNKVRKAVRKAYLALSDFKADVQKMGERAVKLLEESNQPGIVLAGRPYHIDPEINHGIPELINSYGFAVLTEDSISHIKKTERPIRVVDQWMYHSRLYSAASYVRTTNHLDLIQLNSFGCGLDAVTTDQVQELLDEANKLYTVLKIDEVNNLGAARIRIRSLMAVLQERKSKNIVYHNPKPLHKKAAFTKEMKSDYTIIAPQISPIHLSILESALKYFRYNVEVLPENPGAVDVGLKYVNNDACYPTIITIGQVIQALQSGHYNLNKTAVILTQTGGGCRATNYIAMLRKALRQSNMAQVPVISLNFVGLEKNPGFKITIPLMLHMVIGVLYGDLLMRCLYKVRPYERIKGSTQKLYDKWKQTIRSEMEAGKVKNFKKHAKQIVADFAAIQTYDIPKPKVGVVGEILVKYHPVANNFVVDLIEKEGGEAVVPDLLDFFMYGFYNNTIKFDLLDGKWLSKLFSNIEIRFVEWLKKPMLKALKGSKFGAPTRIDHMAELASKVVSLGNISGEGWFLTAEMLELIHHGVNNIVCVQPFACLPNHVTGKGVMKALKAYEPQANIVAVDYDPGASEVNQINRIKLMMSVAFSNLKKEQKRNGPRDPASGKAIDTDSKDLVEPAEQAERAGEAT